MLGTFSGYSSLSIIYLPISMPELHFLFFNYNGFILDLWSIALPQNLFLDFFLAILRYKCFHMNFKITLGEGSGNPLQYSCPENPRDGGAWQSAIYGVAQNQTWLKQLSSSSRSSKSHQQEIWFGIVMGDHWY